MRIVIGTYQFILYFDKLYFYFSVNLTLVNHFSFIIEFKHKHYSDPLDTYCTRECLPACSLFSFYTIPTLKNIL